MGLITQMHLFDDYKDIPQACRGSVIALGNFDGFHRGHQQVVGAAARIARDMGVTLSVLTFEPHPVSYFAPNKPDFRLTDVQAKARLMEKFGVDQLFVLPFNEETAAMPAEVFVDDVLVKGLGVYHVVTGYDYRFGAGRGGGTEMLSYMGDMEGFGVTVVTAHGEDDKIFSSTLVRECLTEGRVRDAADIIGHWWCVEGKVQKGDQRGRTIDFPTLNVPMTGYQEPKLGVYACRIEVYEGEHKGRYDGVMNVGMRPTFDKEDVLLEAHVFDFAGDLYDIPVRIEFVDFIRSEKKFNGLEELQAQIKADAVTAREILADPKNASSPLRAPTFAQWDADHS